MPKVMPVMLEKVGKVIPMPDNMKEQMPDLMSKVMDNLMPHMIGDVVPMIAQPMIDYLNGKDKKKQDNTNSLFYFFVISSTIHSADNHNPIKVTGKPYLLKFSTAEVICLLCVSSSTGLPPQS